MARIEKDCNFNALLWADCFNCLLPKAKAKALIMNESE